MAADARSPIEFESGASPLPVEVILIDDVEWDVASTGANGPAVVLLTGVQGTISMLSRLIDQLAPDHRVVAIDAPAEPDPRRLAHGLEALLARLAIEHASFLAPTWSGYWLQQFAASTPGRIDQLLLVCSYVDPSAIRARLTLPTGDANAFRSMSLGLIAGLIRDRPHEADVLERIRRMVETEQSAARLMARIRGAFASGPADRIRIDEAKLTIVDCSDDPLVSPAMRDQLPIRYPGARHVRLESGGHFAVMTQAPRLAALVRERPRSGPAFS